MDRDNYHKKVIRTIEECSYKFYVIKRMMDFNCPCINPTTKQANIECPKCLGTGKRITIKIIYGASNEELKGRLSNGTEATQIIKKYFVKEVYSVNELDIIVDNDSMFYVNRIEHVRGLKGTFTHQEVYSIKLKNDHDIRIKNFYSLIEKHQQKGR